MEKQEYILFCDFKLILNYAKRENLSLNLVKKYFEKNLKNIYGVDEDVKAIA